jgi:light-regulated signal transduction histidine kinase (bacteriophytochrome)
VGADDYIQKSSELEVLKARLRAQIRRKQFEDENRRIREELLRHELATAQAEASRVLAETRATLLDELERKNKELEAFSYSVSHDLRAPLRSIDGFSQALLEDYADRLDARGQDYLRRVRAAAQRMAELIDDLLQLSRVGRSELRRDRVDLAQLARSVLAELQSHEPERTVEARIQDRLPVEVDARLMKIVLDNLLGNAWKFTSHTQSPMIELGVDELATGPAYFIRDNGVGFDMKYADKLFGVFQRLHKQEEFPGTGIGLATVQRIVDRHGGRVWAESEPGAGAKFSFTLNAVKGS